MPDRRSWRGPHPKDRECFAPESLPNLRAAVDDLSWLRQRGYSSKAAVALVGNRHALRDRQRMALQRCAAGETESRHRRSRQTDCASLRGETIVIDGYNVLLTLEAGLSGGVLLLARDGALRDVAAMSAHYRRVEATRPAIVLIAEFLKSCDCRNVIFYLDRPVSNSARLGRVVESAVAGSSSRWDVRLVEHVDRALKASPHIVATADSVVLDRCDRWFNLARAIVEQAMPDAWIVDLRASVRATK